MATDPIVSAREAGFAARAAKLVGVDPALVHNVSAEEWRGEHGGGRIIRLEIIKSISHEEALRLRYGDDAVIEHTDAGWTVSFPAVVIPPDVPLVE